MPAKDLQEFIAFARSRPGKVNFGTPGVGTVIRFRGMALRHDYEVAGHHIMWIFGVDSLEAALKKLEPFRLDGVVQKMRCPFLLTHGADDEQIPLADAQALFNACGSKDKTLRIFTAEEGGSQHCQRDYLSLGTAEMWDWFEEKLVRKN